MSEATACAASCGRPSDGWIVCKQCSEHLKGVLVDMGWMLDELDTVITGQARYVDDASGKAAEMPMVFDVKASETRAYLVNEISTAVRLIEDANKWKSGATSEKVAAAWLLEKVSAIRLHPAGGDIVDGIMRWWAAAMMVIDRPAQRQYLGDCGVGEGDVACPGRIYGRAGKPEARCDTCGATYEADEMREWLLKRLDDQLCTAAEIARLSTYLGLDIGRDQVRKRINQWHKRGVIQRKGGAEDSPEFRFGEALALLARHDTSARAV